MHAYKIDKHMQNLNQLSMELTSLKSHVIRVTQIQPQPH